jgi:hypothetical protein
LNILRRKIFACAFLWLPMWSGFAQEPEKSQAKILITTKLVVLSVTVRDGAGNLVGDLTAEDFRVLDDDVEQTLDVFVKEGQPISFVVLIDNDVNGKEGFEMVRSLRAVLAGISLQDETMVCRFDTVFYPGDGFISDGDKLMAELKSTQSEIKPTPKYIPQPVVSCPLRPLGRLVWRLQLMLVRVPPRLWTMLFSPARSYFTASALDAEKSFW